MTYIDHTDGSFSLRVGNRSVIVKVDGPEEAEVFRKWLAATPALSEDRLRTALAKGLADALTIDWPGDTRLTTAPAIADYLLKRPEVRAALRASDSESRPEASTTTLLAKIGALAGHPHYLPQETVKPLLDAARSTTASRHTEGLDGIGEGVRDATQAMRWTLPLVLAVRAWRDTPRTTKDMRLGQRLEQAILDAIGDLDEYARLAEADQAETPR